MKRYLLFFGRDCYDARGWESYHGAYDTPEKAKDGMTAYSTPDWWQIIDSETEEIVEES